MKKVFVSHSYADKDIATRIIDYLLIPIFDLDKKNDIFFTSKRETGIKSSLNWRNKIKSSLKEANIFVALITTNFKKSEMCLNELGAAWISEKRIFALIIPPITFKNFSIVISDLQADNLLEKDHVYSFVDSLSLSLLKIYRISTKEEVKNQSIKRFSISLKRYLNNNPNVFIEKKIASANKSEEKPKIQPTYIYNAEEHILSKIREKSKTEWPEDFSMQEYYIKEQTNAYLAVNSLKNENKNDKTISSIIEKAIKEYPKDYEMQLYTANEQIASYKRLNNNT